MRKRYRYVLNGCVLGEDKISDFRLIAGNNISPAYNGEVAIRVEIPNDLKLTKYSCDPYSTTDDERTINELGYDVLIWNKGKWKIRNEFKGVRPCDIPLHTR